MEKLLIRLCTDNDLELLSIMNKQLIEDEKHDNPMNLNQLNERMYGFIHSDYNAYIFQLENKVIGYALVNYLKSPIYLRQFFIVREVRRKGYGKRMFDLLIAELNVKTIDIEVMVWNEQGKAFWESLGFKERSVYMRYS